jgi:integrase
VKLEHLQTWLAGRDIKVSTARKEIEHARGLFSYCVDHDLVKRNYAKKLKVPKPAEDDEGVPTMPYTIEEIRALLAACDRIDNHQRESAGRARLRARACLLLLLYSGLRISDAMKLRRSALIDKRLKLRTHKTKVDVTVCLHTDAVAALMALPIVRRQLFLCIDDNYFSGSTTTTFSVPFGEGEARRRCFLFSLSVREYLRLWESWKPVFGFPLFHQPRRRSGGNGGISPAVGVISKGLVERVGSLLLAFRAFHRPVISTALLVVSFWFWHRPLHSFSPRFSVSLFFKACSAL